MTDFVTLMGWITLAVTLMMFSTGIFPCIEMWKSGSTRNVPFQMFLLGSIGCITNFHYGLLLQNGVIIFLNAVGSVLQTIYTFLYLYIVRSKGKPLFYIALTGAFFAVLYTYLYQYIVTEKEITARLGAVASSVSTLMLVLPVFELYGNVVNKNADGMPPVMLSGAMACSCSWLIYGSLIGDFNVMAPNIPGLVVLSAKAGIVMMYGQKKEKTS